MKYFVTACDSETHLIPPMGKVNTQPVAPPLVCVQISASHADNKKQTSTEFLQWNGHTTLQVIRHYLQNSEYIVMHNAPFDIRVLVREYPELEPDFRLLLTQRRLLDTRVMFALRWPDYEDRYSLKNLVKVLFNHELDKGAVRTSFRREYQITPEQANYAMEDANWTRRAAERLLDVPLGGLVPEPCHFSYSDVRCVTGTQNPDAIFSTASGWQAFNVESIGMEVIQAKLDEYHAAAERVCNQIMLQLYEEGLSRPTRDRTAPIEADPESLGTKRAWAYAGDYMVRKGAAGPERCAVKWTLIEKALRALYKAAAETLKLEPPLSEKTGEISMKYDFWKQYRDELPQSLQIHLRLGKQRKLLSAFFEPMKKAFEGRVFLRVYPNIGVAFAQTGRWTCWKPNLQQQPKAIRDMYRSPFASHVLVSADYKSLEMYTACDALHFLGIRNGPLRKILDAGGDIHISSAKLLFGECTGKDDERRAIAKMCNFALLGGMGVNKFWAAARANGFNWTYELAEAVHTRWFTIMEDCNEFLHRFKIDPWTLQPANYLKRGWLQLLQIEDNPWPSKWELSRKINDGRIYRITLPDGRSIANRRFSQAANGFFQGLGATVVSHAFNKVCAENITVALVVHDEIVTSCPPSLKEYTGDRLVACMKEGQEEVLRCGVKIPLPEYKVSEVWS